MSQSIMQFCEQLVDRINEHGCRVVIPYGEPSPLAVMFDGNFDGAEFIPSYPATLHIYGMPGHVSVSCINTIEQIRHNKYVVNFGDDSQQMDLMVKILE